MTPTVPVTASSQHDDTFSAQRACLDNSLSVDSGGETTLREYRPNRFIASVPSPIKSCVYPEYAIMWS